MGTQQNVETNPYLDKLDFEEKCKEGYFIFGKYALSVCQVCFVV